MSSTSSRQNSNISSFFKPLKKSENDDAGTKVSVKKSLKSSNLPTFATKSSMFNPIKQAASGSNSRPVSRSSSVYSGSSTENLAEHLSKFRFEGTPTPEPKPIIDLTTPTRRLTQRQSDSSNENSQSITDSEEEDSMTYKRRLRKRKPMKKINTYIFSSEEEEEDEDENEDKGAELNQAGESKSSSQESDGTAPSTRASTPSVNKRKRRIVDSDDDNDNMAIDDDGVDSSYMDNNEKQNTAFSLESTEKENIERVKRIHPDKTMGQIVDAVRHAGSVVGACRLLMRDNVVIPKAVKKPRLIDEDELQERQRQRLNDIQRERLVLRYFNTCTAKDLQDVTGCKADIAEYIVNELRPFPHLEDLEEKLKQTKGASVRYIASCREMMEGYTAVDEIIASIEKLGLELRNVFNIWEQLGSNSQSSSPTDLREDDQPGMHMANIDTHIEDYKSDPKYADALKGYLTTQPKCVNPAFTLKDYQILGVNWMLLLYRKGISGILADEMGLGKTAQVITFLGRLYELGDYGPHLIVVPSSTIENWAREFERFVPNLEVRVYHGSQQERAELREDLKHENKQKAFQVVLTTYQLASGHVDDKYFLRKLRCRSMILDEGHMVKNCNSARYKSLMAMKTPFRLLLTGTPLQNNLQELVSLLTFIMPETFANFEDEVRSIFKIRKSAADKKNDSSENKGTETSVQVLSKERILRAKRMMTPFVLRRRKEDVLKDLPQKKQIVEYCEMTERQNAVYSEIILRNKANYEKTAEELENNTKAKSSDFDNLSNVVMHLRKAADHPLLFRHIYTDELLRKMAKELRSDVKYWDSVEELIYEDMSVMSDFELHRLCLEEKKIEHHRLQNDEWMDTGKVRMLQTLLPQFKKDGNKVLIFSQFTRMLDILELCLNTIGTSYLRLDGATDVMSRQALIDDFNNDDDIDVFLLSTKAGGFGINLTSANIVVLYDLDFNPQNDKQAEDRAHRVGQTKDVTIYKLIAKDTIEENILSMANLKLRLDKNVSAKEDQSMDDLDDEKQKRSLVSIIKDAFKTADRRLLH